MTPEGAGPGTNEPPAAPDAWWAAPASAVLLRLGTSPSGLDTAAARQRLRSHGPNEIRAERRVTRLGVLLAQLRSPLLLLLVFAATVSALEGELADTAIVLRRRSPARASPCRSVPVRFRPRFMVEFGLLSSAFDVLTFAVLLRGFAATPATFRTGWFVESLLTELAIALVVRTRRPFWRSRPGTLLLASTCLLVAIALAIPWLPGAAWMGFVPLPGTLLATAVGITLAYVVAAEATKHWFYREGRAASPA